MSPRIAFALTTLLLLAGCAAGTDKTELESWRGRTAAAAELSFTADITAQGPDAVWEFTGDVRRKGEEIRLTLTAPESIRGISVRSAPGKGSRFTVNLAFRIAQENEKPEEESAAGKKFHVFRKKKTGEKRSLDGIRVLVAEDNELNREIAVSMLENMHIAAEAAENG